MLTVKMAAIKAGVSPSLVYAWVKEQRLACLRVGRMGRRGSIRIDPDDLDKFVTTLRQEVHPFLMGVR
jgi:excisionase family DNA binding protein